MKVVIDENKCIGCGTCVAVAPKTFKLGTDSKAKAIKPSGDDKKTIKDAVDSCPVKALKLTD